MKAESKKNTNAEEQEDGNIDKVRDILFGAQMRESDRKLSKLEDAFSKELEGLRQETNSKLIALEQYIKNEFMSLTERLVSEQNARMESVKSVTSELQNLSHNMDKKVTQINDQAAKSESGLREQLLNQSKNLMDDAQRRHAEVLGKLETESSEIRNDKADRSHIAQLFTEMALRLTDDFKLPED